MGKMHPRHYVIVVHGIGEQKENETATAVVHRFAEARHPEEGIQYENLLPSYLSAQSIRRGGMGHGWSEFKGIPVLPGPNTKKFDGSPATETSGQNFRFVDLHWARILQRHQKYYASPVERWAPALLDRFKEEKNIAPKGWLPPWAEPLLESMVGTLLPIKRLLALWKPKLAKRIFDDFLGDVHLYGDYARTRGRAVRHFHVILDEIFLRDFIDWCHRDEKQQNPYQPPVFTIIAHSLGTVLSFDALVYAHAKREVREMYASSQHSCPSLPFPGYTFYRKAERDAWEYLLGRLSPAKANDPEENKTRQMTRNRLPEFEGLVGRETADLIQKQLAEIESNKPGSKPDTEIYKIPLLLWRNQVKRFISLGSPIDKYHALWFQNYLHMGLNTKDGIPPANAVDFTWWTKQKGTPDSWLDPATPRIVHYNLCDEQDPVGHHLDLAQASENYKKVFDTTSTCVAHRDVVFRRYAVPGVAHVKYWEDRELFQGILSEVIDPARGSGKKTVSGYFADPGFRLGDGTTYKKALVWAYFRIPFAAAMITGLLLTYGVVGWAHGGFSIAYLAAILAAVLLWTAPRPIKEYETEARPGPAKKPRRWKFKRSILAHLVAGMVEWRRILTRKSEGQSTDRATCLAQKTRLALKLKWGFLKNAWWRYLGGLAVFTGSAYAAGAIGFAGHPFQPERILSSLAAYFTMIRTGNTTLLERLPAMGLILSSCYLATMLYALLQYFKAKKESAGGK